MNLQDKRVLITGGAGTVGKMLLKMSLDSGAEECRVLDNNETELFFRWNAYMADGRVRFFLGDVRDKDKLVKVTRGTDIVFHAAAYKHVILSEFNPFDVIQTNILGTQNIIEAALVNNVEKVIFTSSDKAVNPTNVMGTSKLMSEKLMTAANTIRHDKQTIFASTRFGNVLGSRGSVVPIFKKQIEAGEAVTITDRRMTRFIMTVEEAARLVLQSAQLAKGGEVFVTKMPVIRIPDLAEAMVEILGPACGRDPDSIPVVEIGKKPGEKLYEELMSSEEITRAVELEKLFAVLPAFKELYRTVYDFDGIVSSNVERPYISSLENVMDKQSLKAYLLTNRVIEESY